MKNTTFQEGLSSFMKRKDYTQSTLADAIGVTRMALNYWVHGKHEPLLRDIKKLLDAGMTLEEIFGAEVMDRIIENEKDSTNAILRHIHSQSLPHNEEPKKETRSEKQKAGFMSRLAMLFSAKR